MHLESNFCPACGSRLALKHDGERERPTCTSKSCGLVFYGNPVPVVAAIVEHGPAVVLVRNKGWPAKWFGLVTGFLERGETPVDGVLREVREELGLTGEVVRLVGVYPFFEMNQVIIAYHVRATGEVVPGAEIETFKEIPAERLKPWASGTGQAVADWLAARGKTG